MKKTGLALGVLALGAVAWEFYALSDRADDVWTITAFVRSLPCWGTSIVWAFVGALVAHFYWQ